MDFDEGWRRLEKILLWGGVVFFLSMIWNSHNVWIGASGGLVGMSPYVGCKCIKWILDGFKGKKDETD